MLQLWEWHRFRGNDGGAVAFPHLQHLYIQNCPNLTKGLPVDLVSLKTLVIDQCQQLRASLPNASDIRELKLQNCHKVSFNELQPKVLKLTIGGYDSLVSLPPIMFLLSCGIADTLKSLHLERCGKFLFPMHQCYASLESLCIICCDSLELFSFDLFPKLNHLDIQECQSLLSLAVSNQGQLENLKSLQISNCSSFVSFPEEGLPAPNLTMFRVYKCNKLKALPKKMQTLLPSLATLILWHCPELNSLPEGGLPSSWNSLDICFCDKLTAGHTTWGLQGLPSLRSFCIRGEYENWNSFPDRGFLPSSLISLEIWSLQHLKSLVGDELQHLTALKKLGIGCCPNLQRMPEDGLPTSYLL